jgi:hypothetical protein
LWRLMVILSLSIFILSRRAKSTEDSSCASQMRRFLVRQFGQVSNYCKSPFSCVLTEIRASAFKTI